MTMVDAYEEILYNLEKNGKTIEDVVSVNVKVYNSRYKTLKYFNSMEKLVSYLKKIKYDNYLAHSPEHYKRNTFVIEGIILFSDKTWLEREIVLYRYNNYGNFLCIDEPDNSTLDITKDLVQEHYENWYTTVPHESWVYHKKQYEKDVGNYFEGDMYENVEKFLSLCNKTLDDIKSLELFYSHKFFDILKPIKNLELLKYIKDSENYYICGHIIFKNKESAQVWHKKWTYYAKNHRWIKYGRV